MLCNNIFVFKVHHLHQKYIVKPTQKTDIQSVEAFGWEAEWLSKNSAKWLATGTKKTPSVEWVLHFHEAGRLARQIGSNWCSRYTHLSVSKHKNTYNSHNAARLLSFTVHTLTLYCWVYNRGFWLKKTPKHSWWHHWANLLRLSSPTATEDIPLFAGAQYQSSWLVN